MELLVELVAGFSVASLLGKTKDRVCDPSLDLQRVLWEPFKGCPASQQNVLRLKPVLT